MCGLFVFPTQTMRSFMVYSMPYFFRFSSSVFRLMPRIFAALTFLPRV